jgi:RNase P protein component
VWLILYYFAQIKTPLWKLPNLARRIVRRWVKTAKLETRHDNNNAENMVFIIQNMFQTVDVPAREENLSSSSEGTYAISPVPLF